MEAQLVLMPVAVGLVKTHMYRKQVYERPSPAYRDVTFTSTDGLTLSGWCRPSRNGTLRHAGLLASHGYGVLVYDARGTGRSEGTPNGWGWFWDRDVAGALTYLRSRPDVDPQRIGGLGLSTGADVLIEVAAEQPGQLAAVVGDGATALRPRRRRRRRVVKPATRRPHRRHLADAQ